MKLENTVELMNSKSYQDRFKAEYLQLEIRIAGLTNMLSQYKLGILPFIPDSSYDLLNGQLKSMQLYASYLEDRAAVENIDLMGE